MEIERLDICNIIEVDKIRKLLIRDPDLLSMFEILVIIVNNRINGEEPCLSKSHYEKIEENLKYLPVDSESSDDDDDNI